MNRGVFLGLTLLAIVILLSRSFPWGDLFKRNLFLMALLFFALISACWSDFPLIAFKRWFRDAGAGLAMLVVLSDPDPLEAVRAVLRRLCYLMIPLSVLLVKYYPEMGRAYDAWTGVPVDVGATTTKNMLGVTCLIAGIFFFWDVAIRWPDRRKGRTKRILLVNIAFIAMAGWLLRHANSATSDVCLGIGCLAIVAVVSKPFKRHLAFVKVLIPTCFCSYVVLAYWFNANAYLVGAVGRNPTLTDRTFIWETLLRIGTNPLVGTGYRSFFLGTRLQEFWKTFPGINEAHNGYLDIYLNLGIIGLVLLFAFLVMTYRTIWGRVRTVLPLLSLGLAIWIIMLFYNITEAAFDGGLLWMILMLVGGVSLSTVDERQASGATVVEDVLAGVRFSRVPPETTGFRKSLPTRSTKRAL